MVACPGERLMLARAGVVKTRRALANNAERNPKFFTAQYSEAWIFQKAKKI
jgi:hypothetical protein